MLHKPTRIKNSVTKCRYEIFLYEIYVVKVQIDVIRMFLT